MDTRTVYGPSGKAIKNVPADVSDEEAIERAQKHLLQQASVKEQEGMKQVTPQDKELQLEVEKQTGVEPSVGVDLQRVVHKWGEGISSLVTDAVINPIAKYGFGVEEAVTDADIADLTKSLASVVPGGAPQEELFTAEGKVKDTETIPGMVAEIGSVVAGGAGVAKGLSMLPSIIKYGLAGATAEQVVYGDDANVARTLLDDTELLTETGMARDVAEFLATNEEDSALENRLKVSMEGFLLGGTLSALIGTTTGAVKYSKKLYNKIPSQLTSEEQADVALNYLKDARKKAEYKAPNSVVFSETAETAAQVEQQASSKINRFMRQMFTSRGYWTVPAFNAFEDSQYAQRQLIAESENISNRLQKALRSLGDETQTKEMSAKVQDALSDKLEFHSIVSPEGKIKYVQEQYGFTPEVAEEVLNARTLIDDMSKTLANSSIPDNEFKATILSNSGEYIRRSYRLFEDTGYKPSANVKKEAVDYYAEAIQSANPSMSYEEAVERAGGKVDEILTKGDSADSATEYYEKVRRVNTEILKGKKEIPEPIRKLMGEINEPAENIVLTVSKLAKLVESNKFFESLNTMGQGKYIFDEAVDRGNAKYVVKITGTNSVLDGKYTTNEMVTAIKEQESMVLNGKDVGLVKLFRNFATLKGKSQAAKTVYSHVTHLRNVIGGAQFGLANGVNPFTSGGATFRTIANQISKGGDKELDAAYEKYLRLGIINTDVKVNEFRALLNTGAESSAETLFENLSKKASQYGLSERAQSLPGDIYMAVDDFYKINNFERELETLRKAFPDESLEVLEEEAAFIVQQTLPNYDRVPKGIKATRYLPIGNFVAFPTEMWRTSANILRQGAKEIGSGNKDLVIRGSQRLAGFTTAMTGVSGLAYQSAKLAGLTEDEQEAIQTMSNTPWSKSPRIITRGEDGKLYTADTQFIDSYSPIKTPFNEAMYQIEQGQLRGKELDDVLGDAILAGTKSVLAPYIGESMLTEAFTDIYSAWQSPDGRTNSGKLLIDPNEDRIDQAITVSSHLLSSFVPGSVDSLVGLGNAAFEVPNKNTGKPKDFNAELATNLTGVRFTEFSPEDSLMYGVKNYNFEKRNIPFAKADYKKTGNDVYDQFVGRQKQLYKNQQEMYMKVLASEQLLGRSQTVKVLHENGLSKKEIGYLLSGYYRGEKPNMGLISDVYKQTPGLDDGQKKKLIQDLIRVHSELSQTRLYPANEEQKFEAPETRLQKAKGGEVSVPQAPREPDERIDKFTGKPYNQQAGAAFMDVTDPERRMELNKGGKVKSKIDEMLDEVLIAEGGYQETKEDRGNIIRSDGTVLGTNYGITPQVYAEHKRTSVDKLQPKDIKNITEQEAREIYKDKFYNRTRIQDIKDENLRANVLDMAINAGPRNAVKLLQKELGVKADGVLGPETLKKLNSMGVDTNTYSDRRLDYYKGITNSTPNEQVSWARRAEKYKIKNPTKHKVSKGETLFNIAKKYNTTPENLAILNGITDPSNIPVNFNLKLK